MGGADRLRSVALLLAVGGVLSWLTVDWLTGEVVLRLRPAQVFARSSAYSLLPDGLASVVSDRGSGVYEDGRPLTRVSGGLDEVRDSTGVFWATEVRSPVDGRSVPVVYFSSTDGSDPWRNGRDYTVRCARRSLPASFALVVVVWSLAAGVVVTLCRDRGVSHVLPAVGDVASWTVLLVGLTYSMFVVGAWLHHSHLAWLLAVVVMAAPLAVVRAISVGVQPPAWAPAVAGLTLWAGCTVRLGGPFGGADDLTTLVVAVAGGGLVWIALSGSLAVHRRPATQALAVVFMVACVLSLARDAGFDVWGSGTVSTQGPGVPGLVVNPWTAKFVGHWVLVALWCSAAATAVGRRLRLTSTFPLMVLAVITVVLNGSRSAVAALVASAVVGLVAWWRPRGARWFLVVTLAAGVLTAPLLAGVPWAMSTWTEGLSERGGTIARTIAIRGGIWEYGRRLVAHRPVTGLGVGSTSTMPGRHVSIADALAGTADGADHALDTASALPDGHPHNAALQIWMDLGLIGALLATGLVWAIGRSIARVEDNRLQHAALLGLLTVNATYLAFNYPLWEPEVLSILWMSAALASTVLPKPAVSRRELVRNVVVVGVILAVGVSVLVTGKISRRLVARDLRTGTILQLGQGTVRDDRETWTLDFDGDLDAGARVVQPDGVDRPLVQGWAYAPRRGEPDHVVVFIGSEPVQVVWPERPTKEVFLRTEDRDVRALTAGFVFWTKDDWLAHEDPVTIVATYGGEHLAVQLPPLSELVTKGSD